MVALTSHYEILRFYVPMNKILLMKLLYGLYHCLGEEQDCSPTEFTIGLFLPQFLQVAFLLIINFKYHIRNKALLLYYILGRRAIGKCLESNLLEFIVP